MNEKTEVVNVMIKEGAELKEKISELTAKLQEINKFLAEKAEYKEGSKTGHIESSEYSVKIQKRENTKWDQERLLKIKEVFPDEFEKGFKIKYEPNAKVLNALTVFADEKLKKGLAWASKTTPGAPQVSYEKIENKNEKDNELWA